MKPPLEPEWKRLFKIAHEDRSAFRVLLHAPEISLAMSCFHGQQAAEKYMKAVLAKNAIPFPFTHNLVQLHALLAEKHITPLVPPEQLEKLNPFAVKQRYDQPPILHLTHEEAEAIVDKIANWCEKQLHD